MSVEIQAEDMQLSTNRIVNNLLIENMNLGAQNEALTRALQTAEQENSRLRKQVGDTNGEVPEDPNVVLERIEEVADDAR